MTNAVLLKDVALVVRDVSSGGCLIESCTPLQVGTVGRLEVEFEGARRFEWFRVARVDKRGERAYVSGVEFLPLAAAGADSLRSAIGRLRRTTPELGSTEVTGRSSVDTGNSAREVGEAREKSASPIADSARKIVDFFRRRQPPTSGSAVAHRGAAAHEGVRGSHKEKTR